MLHRYIYLLTISAFLSITVFEVFLIFGVVYTIFHILKTKRLDGMLSIPLLMFISSTILSTLLFFPKMIIKSLGEGGNQIIYFLPVNKTHVLEFKKRLPHIFISLGVILSPVFFYNFYFKDRLKLLWGGPFEVGQFYAIFSISSLLLMIREVRNGRNNLALIYFVLSVLFIGIVILSARRSALLALLVVLFIFIFILFRDSFIERRYLAFPIVATLTLCIFGYIYLSYKDHRFQLLNEVILGKRSISEEVLNSISSSRWNIMKDGLIIIENDLKEGRFVNILLGHGVRSGLYLPHKYGPQNWERYESIFVISEFIEKGLVGLMGILLIFILSFKKVLSFRVRKTEDILTLVLFMPLLLHLVGSVFTFFWDAILPLYLLLFKLGESRTALSKNGAYGRT